jgi:hypothetical protein
MFSLHLLNYAVLFTVIIFVFLNDFMVIVVVVVLSSFVV